MQDLFYILSKPFNIFVFLLYYLVLVLMFAFKLKANNFAKNLYEQYFELLLKVGLTYMVIVISYAAMKFSFNLPRPYCSMEYFISVQNFAFERCLSSFPSAHTAMAVFIYYISFPYLRLSARVFGVILVSLVALSRISLAMHFPADILYSVIISFVLCYFTQQLLEVSWLRQNVIAPFRQQLYAILINLKN